jgi:hypothetical protein
VVADLTGAQRWCQWLRWLGKLAMPWEASLRWVDAPEPTEEERGSPVRSGDGELVMKIEAKMTASVPADSEAGGVNKTQGGGGIFVPMRLEDRWDITDGSTRRWGKGTARCGAKAEHARIVQTAARVPVVAASIMVYAEQGLSMRHYPG